MSETIIQKEGTKLTVIPEERLDTASSPLLREDVLPHLEGVQDITMDFEPVKYISSAGLRVLLELYQEMEDRGGTLKIIHASKSVMAVFRLVNLTEIIPIEES